jgi:hypothetical protein
VDATAPLGIEGHLKDLTAEVMASSLNSVVSEVDQPAHTDEFENDMAESFREGFGSERNRRLTRRRPRVRPNL